MMSTVTLLFSKVSEVQTTAISQEHEIKSIWVRKEEVNPSLFVNPMVLYVENPKDSVKELLEIINENSNVSVYKVNVKHKFSEFLYDNDQLAG